MLLLLCGRLRCFGGLAGRNCPGCRDFVQNVRGLFGEPVGVFDLPVIAGVERHREQAACALSHVIGIRHGDPLSTANANIRAREMVATLAASLAGFFRAIRARIAAYPPFCPRCRTTWYSENHFDRDGRYGAGPGDIMRLKQCHNFHDFRELARRRLPGPIFNYIDGAADDETTYRRNTRAFEDCDLVPSVLTGVEQVDLSVTVLGQKLKMPFYCSPTALHRLFHHQGELAVARAVEKFGTMFGVSSLGTVSLEEIARNFSFPQVYQFYFHKDRGLNKAMMERAKGAGVRIMMLTVDSITGGNRERDLRTGFTIPFRLNLRGMFEFATKPKWAFDHLTHEKFRLPQLDSHVDMKGGTTSIGDYFTNMLDQSMNWRDVADMVKQWDAKFCLKGVMSADDARKAVDIGCAGIVVSNHGGRQLDGSRSTFDQLAEIVDAVGDKIDVLFDGGVQRGTHVLKALSLGAKAVGVGRLYLFPLAAAGQPGVERALGADAHRDRARHEANGLHVHQAAVAVESQISWVTRLSAILLTRVVAGIQVFEAQRAIGRDLGDVLAGLGPVEVPGVAGQNDDAAGRISLYFIAVEPFTEANVENAGHHCVDPIFRVFVRHQFHASGHFDPDHIGAGLRRLADDDGEADRRWERRERLPLDIFGQHRSENGFARLVGSNHRGSPYLDTFKGRLRSIWRPR